MARAASSGSTRTACNHDLAYLLACGATWMATGAQPAPLPEDQETEPVAILLARLYRSLPTMRDVHRWLTSGHPQLGDRSPVDAIAEGDTATVAELALNAS